MLDLPIMSLQTGGELARTTTAIIDPGTLDIVAYRVNGSLLRSSEPSYVRIDDIRELSDIGFIIDSIDEIIAAGDVIKLDEIIELKFYLQNIAVWDEHRHRLGKVIDYTVDIGSFRVEQLTVKRPLMKSFNDPELLIHRTQIIEINPEGIVVHSKASTPEHTRLSTPGSYVNPFRKHKTARETGERR